MNYYYKYLKYKNKYKYIREFQKAGSYHSQDDQIIVASWNILADGLSYGEFLTDLGDEHVTKFDERWNKISLIIKQMFENNLTILSTQENDHPTFIIKKLFSLGLTNIDYIEVKKYPNSQTSSARKIMDGDKKLGVGRFQDVMGREPTGKGITTILANDILEQNNGTYSEGHLKGKAMSPNDTLTIYYNTDIVKIVNPISIVIEHNEGKNKTTYVGGAVFELIKNHSKKFIYINGHLSSGEKQKDAAARINETNNLLKGINDNLEDSRLLPIIITMDSNSSELYTNSQGKSNNKPSYNQTIKGHDEVNNIFIENGYTNTVPIIGNQCLKMRHGSGAQEKKYGLFMFDTIDKILVKNVKNYESLEGRQFFPLFNFYPMKIFEFFKNLREDAFKRDVLQNQVTNQKWSDIIGFDGNNKKLPQEKPLCPDRLKSKLKSLKYSKDETVFVHDCKDHKWKEAKIEKENNNETYNIKYSDKDNTRDTNVGNSRIRKNPNCEIFPRELQKCLYPNMGLNVNGYKSSPSDHPPVATKITL